MKFYRRRVGFTLIELLVVISIIALLVSILMPALSKARGAGQKTVCSARHKQMAMAAIMYAEDNADAFVVQDWRDPRVRQDYWFVRIGEYLDDVKGTGDGVKLGEFMRCPSGLAVKQYSGEPIWHWEALDYAVKRWQGPRQGANGPFSSKKYSSISRPVEFATFFDFYYGEKGVNLPGLCGSVERTYWDNNIKDDQRVWKVLRHGQGINIAYADGHVQYVKMPLWGRHMAPEDYNSDLDTAEAYYGNIQ